MKNEEKNVRREWRRKMTMENLKWHIIPLHSCFPFAFVFHFAFCILHFTLLTAYTSTHSLLRRRFTQAFCSPGKTVTEHFISGEEDHLRYWANQYRKWKFYLGRVARYEVSLDFQHWKINLLNICCILQRQNSVWKRIVTVIILTDTTN